MTAAIETNNSNTITPNKAALKMLASFLMLKAELEGYPDYAEKVRYRLILGVR